MNSNQMDSEDSSSNSAIGVRSQVKNVNGGVGPNSSESDTLRRLNLQDDEISQNEPFYFESDTLALKNNPEYSCLLKTLILLEGQRMKACQDLQKLMDLKEKALNDPLKFVRQLSEGKASETNDTEEDLIPDVPRQMLYVLPEINWNKYYDCVGLEDLETIKNSNIQRTQSLRQLSRLKQQETTTVNDAVNKTPRRQVRIKQEQQQQNTEHEKKQSARSYNKPWGVDEQRQLEELLLEFPPEDNEAARWRKIATKLGTRTPLQVQSHCQKYFIKLAKAGLPIPGRMPNLRQYTTKKGSRGNRKSSLMRGACIAAGVSTVSGMGSGRGRGNKILNVQGFSRRMVGRGVSLNEISSMWSSFNPPVIMNDDHDDHHLHGQSSRADANDGQMAGTSGSLYYNEDDDNYFEDDEADEGDEDYEGEEYEEGEEEEEDGEYANEEDYEAYEDSNDQAK